MATMLSAFEITPQKDEAGHDIPMDPGMKDHGTTQSVYHRRTECFR